MIKHIASKIISGEIKNKFEVKDLSDARLFELELNEELPGEYGYVQYVDEKIDLHNPDEIDFIFEVVKEEDIELKEKSYYIDKCLKFKMSNFVKKYKIDRRKAYRIVADLQEVDKLNLEVNFKAFAIGYIYANRKVLISESDLSLLYEVYVS